jgi:hypothetical protein
MRPVISLLAAALFVAAAEASATGVAATPQSQAALSAPKAGTIDQIRHPTATSLFLAQRMCQTQCNWIGGRQFCNTYCF